MSVKQDILWEVGDKLPKLIYLCTVLKSPNCWVSKMVYGPTFNTVFVALLVVQDQMDLVFHILLPLPGMQGGLDKIMKL